MNPLLRLRVLRLLVPSLVLGFAVSPARASLFTPSGVDAPATPRPATPPPAKVTPDPNLLTTPPAKEGDYFKLGFDRLAAFPFTPPDYDPVATPNKPPPDVDGQIPEAIKKFDGQKAIVTGFMMPVRMEDAYVVEFMLVRTPSLCCYGIVPNVNEWVVVKMKPGANIRATMDMPVAIYGTLHVHGQFDNGYLSGIYMLDGERMEIPKAPPR